MTKSEKTILEAIKNLQSHFDKSLSNLKDELSRTQDQQHKQGRDIKAVTRRQDKHDVDIAEIRSILDDLIRSDALIRRTDKQAVIRKEPLYDRFGRIGVDSRTALKALEQTGYLDRRDIEGKRTTVIKLPGKNENYRAVIINING